MIPGECACYILCKKSIIYIFFIVYLRNGGMRQQLGAIFMHGGVWFTEGKGLFTEKFIKKVKNCKKLENKSSPL